MPNHRSAEKRVRSSLKRQLRNNSVKSAARTAVKRCLTAIEQKDESAPDYLRSAAKQLDKAAAKGVIHKNQAARRKSRLTKRLNQAAL